ncbi:MAG: carbon storage regulator CsrA [Solirubrobacteraceae bacterium]
MLVLTRKSNQSIMIGDNIEVSVLAIMGEKVRIGIQADRTVPVFRKEVYLEIQAEQQAETPTAEDDGAAEADADAEANGAAQNGRHEVDAALRSLGGPE